LTVKRLRRDSFENVASLVKAIEEYIAERNQNPHIFVWTATAESIMRKIAICKEALDAVH